MALVEDSFKGNLAIEVRAVLLGPPLVQTIGGLLRPATETAVKG